MSHDSPLPPDLGLLSDLAPSLASTFVMLSSDIALVIDRDGVIRTVAEGGQGVGTGSGDWVGRPWVETVTPDTRVKLEKLLQEVQSTGLSRRREVNHPSVGGPDIPMAYTAVRLGEQGPVLAVGRDLRAVAAIQQRFIDTQQEMERNYWRLRQDESRYRVLFQVANDAVLVVDADSLRVVEANEAAFKLFRRDAAGLVGQRADSALDAASRSAFEELLVTARASEKSAGIRVRLPSRPGLVDVSAMPFRAPSGHLLLVRARPTELRLASGGADVPLEDFIRRTPDAVVVTDSSGRVLMANPAFAKLARVPEAANLKGRSLAEALGEDAARLATVLSRVREQGILTPLPIEVHGGSSRPQAAELSAALLAEGDQECVGFTLRLIGERSAQQERQEGGLAAGDSLASHLGRLSLPELLLEASRRAEHQLIVEALSRSLEDAGAAARLLGVSTESLLLRMHRLDIAAQEERGSESGPSPG